MTSTPSTPERPSTVTVPIDVMEQIDRAIKFYASFETYLPPRIAGVLGGCERSGDIPVIVDRGRNAMDVLTQLIKLYPMVQTPQSESERSVLVKKVEAFATLPDNWDSYGSKKFPPRTILLAREIAAKLGPEWSAVPCADGPSVWLTRDNENDILEIRTSDDE